MCVIFYLTLLGWLDNGPIIDLVYISCPDLRECTNVADVWFWGSEHTHSRFVSYHIMCIIYHSNRHNCSNIDYHIPLDSTYYYYSIYECLCMYILYNNYNM